MVDVYECMTDIIRKPVRRPRGRIYMDFELRPLERVSTTMPTRNVQVLMTNSKNTMQLPYRLYVYWSHVGIMKNETGAAEAALVWTSC